MLRAAMRAVAVVVLGAGVELATRAAERRNEHQGVVAEAAGALRRAEDLAVPAPGRDQRLGVVGRRTATSVLT